ncbi:MAG: TnpV protein [Lachnospiraceae bacterium]|nr:TnpV protein [Lachnospiraceae bacterium]
MEAITYYRRGDYLFPNIILSEPPPETVPPLGVYGLKRQKYLKEHRPILYSKLLLSERLYPHLRETDEAAAHRLAVITDRYQAEEIINELIYE